MAIDGQEKDAAKKQQGGETHEPAAMSLVAPDAASSLFGLTKPLLQTSERRGAPIRPRPVFSGVPQLGTVRSQRLELPTIALPIAATVTDLLALTAAGYEEWARALTRVVGTTAAANAAKRRPVRQGCAR